MFTHVCPHTCLYVHVYTCAGVVYRFLPNKPESSFPSFLVFCFRNQKFRSPVSASDNSAKQKAAYARVINELPFWDQEHFTYHLRLLHSP